MSVLKPITPEMIEASAINAIENVFRTMVHESIAFRGRISNADASHGSPGEAVMGCVGFAGKINGLVYVHFSETFAIHATAKVTGLSEEDVREAGTEVIADAVGELANQVAGGFKNVFCDLGHTCMLSLPTVVTGSHLAVTTVKEASRNVFAFESNAERVTLDVQMKGGQG